MDIHEIEHSVRHVQGQDTDVFRPGHPTRSGQNLHGTENVTTDFGVQRGDIPMDREFTEKLVADVQAKMDAKGIDLTFKVRDDSGVVQVEVLDSKNGTVVHKFPPDSLLKLRKEAEAAAGAFLDRSF